MVTSLKLITKDKKGVYHALFEAGNGGAWNNWYVLHKRASSDDEAIEWGDKLVISRKWENVEPVASTDWLRLLGWDTKGYKEPLLAGSDYCAYKEKSFIVDGGFQISLGCVKDGVKGAELSFNTGSRNKPVWEEDFIEFNCDIELYISFGAGRSSKETVYLDFRGCRNEIIFAREEKWRERII